MYASWETQRKGGRYRRDFDKGVKAYGHKQSSDHKGSQQGTKLQNRNN